MSEEDERLENPSGDDGAPSTINMMVNGGADYQAQVDAVEQEQSQGREIIARNRAQVEDRRRARYEQQDTTNVFDKDEIESERKDLSYSRNPDPPEFMGGNGITTFNGIQYPKPEDTKQEASNPVVFGDNYTPPKRTPPAYNPGAYSILGKNYGTSQKQRAVVQKDAGAFIKTPEFKTLRTQHKENTLQQSGILDFMNPSQDKINSVRNAGVYNPYSGKSEQPSKRIKENPESYSILGSKYFSPTKAGETQRKKVQSKAESFLGTTQFANRIGMVFKDVDRARTEREKHETLVEKANANQNANVGTDALSNYIPKIGVSGGISYPIPRTFSPRRKDETKYEGGTVGVPVKERKTGKIQGVRAPASEKSDKPKLAEVIKGKGVSQEVLKQREESKRAKAEEKLFKDSLPPRTPVAKLDPIVDAGMASYFKKKDVALYTNRKTKREEENAIKMRNAVARLERKESLAYSDKEDKLKSATKEASIFGISLASSHDIMATEKQASQDAESKRQLKQQSDAYANIAKTMGVFAKGAAVAAEEEKKTRAAHEKANPKWLDKRAATISRNAENKTLREKSYRGKTPVLNQVTSVIGTKLGKATGLWEGKGDKPHNYRKDAGEGGVFDKKVEQPIFDAQGNEIGKSVKKVNTFKEFGNKHPILTSLGSRVKQGARKPLDDLLAGRAARGNPQTNRGFLYGGGLQPVNITKSNPVGEFPKKSGRPAAPRRKDPVGGRELAFFGKPFGAPKAPRRTRRGKIVKMTAAQRKRASRKPKGFLDSVFGSKW